MPTLLQRITARDRRLAAFRHYELLVHVYVVVLLISNLVGPKPTQIGPFIFSGAQLLFPITYIFGDVFTEVYGYGGARRAIWIAFLASLLMGAFALPVRTILVMAGSGYLFKVLYEALATPLTYAVVGFLKHTTGVDVFDEGTDFSPFVKDL